MITRMLQSRFAQAVGVVVLAAPIVVVAVLYGGQVVRQKHEILSNLEPAAPTVMAEPTIMAEPSAFGPEIGQKVTVVAATDEYPEFAGYLYQAGRDGWLVVFQEPIPVPTAAMKKGRDWIVAPYFVDGDGAGVGSVIVAGRFRLDELHVAETKLEDDLTTVRSRQTELNLVRTLDWAYKLRWRQDVLAEYVEALMSPKHVSWKPGDVLTHPDFPGLTLTLYRVWTDCRVGYDSNEALAVVIPSGTPSRLPESLVGRHMVTKDNRTAYVIPVSQLRPAAAPPAKLPLPPEPLGSNGKVMS